MTEFHAAVVGAEEMTDNNCYVLVVAEHSDAGGQRLELQSSVSYDEQDKSLGMATYCLCTETGACHYGGVTSWALDEAQAVLVITLDEAASNTLGVAGGCRVTVPPRDLPLLRESLQRILGSRSSAPTGGRMEKLDRPRLLVDFNEVLEPDLYLLARDDEKVDSSGAVVSLSEGMRVYVYEPEGEDDNGIPRYLLATGIVEKNTATYAWAVGVRWCCRIDRWESEEDGAGAMRT